MCDNKTNEYEPTLSRTLAKFPVVGIRLNSDSEHFPLLAAGLASERGFNQIGHFGVGKLGFVGTRADGQGRLTRPAMVGEGWRSCPTGLWLSAVSDQSTGLDFTRE
jgi:hypothetical protein